MSGTSLDGLDVLEVDLWLTDRWHYQLKTAATYAYSKEWQQKLAEAHHFSGQTIENLDRDYTKLLAEITNRFIKENQVKDLDFVASHGHTVFHQPQQNYTLQIGNRSELSNLIQQHVICDFRVQDVALGGQGAPLVPIGDRFLFHDYDACLNLGGFANISYAENNKRIAYDICPVNKVLNFYAEKLGRAFDKDGAIAKAGAVDSDLLEQLNALAFYREQPPKSLGIEWVEKEIFPLIKAADLSPENSISTFTKHVADQLCKALQGKENILITGGGAFNKYLLDILRKEVKVKLILPTQKLIDYKEALIFAFLGVLRFRNENNILAEVTGASKDHSSGKLFRYT
ncbi:MAG: anhydro-N-acetylmuramic acid kinase, partial [Tetragenococcus halophilus]|nr:anhydro-N-acetylmuramic acid kinase [Tetragenococcus halophilus]